MSVKKWIRGMEREWKKGRTVIKFITGLGEKLENSKDNVPFSSSSAL
jgi:hypothetical protein